MTGTTGVVAPRPQLLGPVGQSTTVEDVSAAELAPTRRVQSEQVEVARALAEGTIVTSFACRGATHRWPRSRTR